MDNGYWRPNLYSGTQQGNIYPRYSPNYRMAQAPAPIVHKTFFMEAVDDDDDDDNDDDDNNMGYISRTAGLYYPTDPCPPPATQKPAVCVPAKPACLPVKKCSRCMMATFVSSGLMLMLLSMSSFGFEIANIVVSAGTVCADPRLVYTYIGAGIWASIPIFVTGCLAVTLKDCSGPKFRVLCVICTMCALFFAPAIAALSIVQIATSLYCLVWLPAVVLSLGMIEMIFTFILMIFFCFIYENTEPTQTCAQPPGKQVGLCDTPAPCPAPCPAPYPAPCPAPCPVPYPAPCPAPYPVPCPAPYPAPCQAPRTVPYPVPYRPTVPCPAPCSPPVAIPSYVPALNPNAIPAPVRPQITPYTPQTSGSHYLFMEAHNRGVNYVNLYGPVPQTTSPTLTSPVNTGGYYWKI